MWSFKSIKIINILSIKDQSYTFRNGRCIAISGENLDKNSGQKVNGSGKSAFLEAICLGITGASLRKIKNKDIVFRGEKEAYIGIHMTNKKTNDRLIIERTISTKESTKLNIVHNEQEKKFGKVDDGDKYIIDLIGISFEDLLNYYIISRDRYISFLRSSDSDKKELINRFSKAEKLDKLDVVFKKKIEESDSNIILVEREIYSQQSQWELIKQQIDTIESKNFEEEKKKILAAIKQKKDEEIDLLHNLEPQVFDLEQEVLKFQKELTEIENIDELIETIIEVEEGEKEIQLSIDQLRVEHKNIPKNYQEKVDSILKDQNQYELARAQLSSKIVDTQKLIEKYEQQLLTFIQCPKCKHKFSLKVAGQSDSEIDKALKEEKTKKQTLETDKTKKQTDIDKLSEDKLKVNNSIIDDRDKITKQINELQVNLNELNESKQAVQQQVNEINQNKQRIENHIKLKKGLIDSKNRSIQLYTENIKRYENQYKEEKNKKEDNKQLEELKKKFDDITKELEELKVTLNELLIEKQQKLKWQLDFKSFKAHIANKSIGAINSFINLYLEKIESNLTIQMNGYKIKADKTIKEEISVTVFRDLNDEGDFKKLSGGEKSRIDVCCILALQQLINMASKSGGLDILAIDEIVESLDSYGLDKLVASLQNVNKTIFIITQNVLNESKNNVLLARKENKITELIEM